MEPKAGLLLLALYMAWERRRLLRPPAGKEAEARETEEVLRDVRGGYELVSAACGRAFAAGLTAFASLGWLLPPLGYFALAAAQFPNPAWRAFTAACLAADLWKRLEALLLAPAVLRGEVGPEDPRLARPAGLRVWACDGLPLVHALAAAMLALGKLAGYGR